jgi:hypothetical protein
MEQLTSNIAETDKPWWYSKYNIKLFIQSRKVKTVALSDQNTVFVLTKPQQQHDKKNTTWITLGIAT